MIDLTLLSDGGVAFGESGGSGMRDAGGAAFVAVAVGTISRH